MCYFTALYTVLAVAITLTLMLQWTGFSISKFCFFNCLDRCLGQKNSGHDNPQFCKNTYTIIVYVNSYKMQILFLCFPFICQITAHRPGSRLPMSHVRLLEEEKHSNGHPVP